LKQTEGFQVKYMYQLGIISFFYSVSLHNKLLRVKAFYSNDSSKIGFNAITRVYILKKGFFMRVL